MTPLREDKLTVLSRVEDKGFTAEIVEYSSLEGCRELITSQRIYLAYQAGMRLKMIRLSLSDSTAMLEAGALYFHKGNINVESKAGGTGGIGGFFKGLGTKLLGRESVYRPHYKGTGEIYLEPSFGHFFIQRLGEGETVIADRGMFYCSQGSVSVGLAMQKRFSTALFGGEGAFQLKVTGPGIVVFSSPVPESELMVFELNNEKLQVDGNFALLRTAGINFSVQKSARSIIGTFTTGEGLLQTFEGTGKVWIAPTEVVYEHLANPKTFAKVVEAQGKQGNSKNYLRHNR